MQLTTTRFGQIEIEDAQVITLTQPIIGFAEYRRFVILPGPQEGVVFWLQSTESPDLAFLIVDPRNVMPGYHVSLGPSDLAELAVNSPDEIEIYTLLVVPEDPAKVRTNLRAPILVNRKQRLGRQTILDRTDYPIQYFLAQSSEGKESREVSHARADA